MQTDNKAEKRLAELLVKNGVQGKLAIA